MDNEIRDTATELIGHYGWMFIVGFVFLMFKSSIESLVEGAKVFLGNDLNTDDVISLNGRPGRVVRVGIWKSTVFLYTVENINGTPVITSGNKVSIQNDTLKNHLIEKPLPELDLSKWTNGNGKS